MYSRSPLTALSLALTLGWSPLAYADVAGTEDDDTIVFGAVYHWAVGEMGGWYPRYDGRGGCVFERDGTPPYRGEYLYADYYYDSGTWYAYGMLGHDYMYSPNKFDDDWLDCYEPCPPCKSVETYTQYNLVMYGDTTSISAGSSDFMWANVESTHMYGGGGHDYMYGSAEGDTMEGDYGNDTMLGLGGNDDIYGWEDNDLLIGNDDDDVLEGYYGDDTEYGDNYAGQGGDIGTDACDTVYREDSDTCAVSSPYYCDTEYCDTP